MKKVFVFLLSLFLGAGFISCGGDDPISDEPQNPGTETPDTPGDDPQTPGGSAGKILVVYFSRTGYNYPNQLLDIGHTARVAGFIAELTGGERFEIIPAVPYSDNYQEAVARAREEYDSNARPAIQTSLEHIDDYDTVFIGSPIWHGAVPMIIRTFYEACDLTGKTIVPFTTHAGSGLGNCMSVAREYYPQGTVLDGLAVQGTNSMNARGDVESWLRRIGVIE